MRLIAAAFLFAVTGSANAAEWLVAHDLDGTIPRAARVADDARDEAMCQGEARAPVSTQDRALITAGWLLWGEPVAAGAAVVRHASLAVDGQCRQRGNAVFVHVGDKVVAAFMATDHSRYLGASVAGGELTLSQPFPKEGEAECCPTGRRQLVVSLAGLGVAR